MYKYHLSLGSNIEPRLTYLQKAVDSLYAYGRVIRKSRIYKTAPWGFTDQPEFFNANLRYHSMHPPQKLMTLIKTIEQTIGREPGTHWGPRKIDIDIIWCDAVRIDAPDLKIPHPLFQERRFVLLPLQDVSGELFMAEK